MEERDLERLVASPLKSRDRRALRVSKQGRTTRVPELVTLERISKQIGELERSNRIQILDRWECHGEWGAPGWSARVVDRYPVGTEADVQLFRELHHRRQALERKIGSKRLPAGTVHQFHRNGIGYSINPYWAWAEELLHANSCDLRVRGRSLSLRDRTIWFLWNFRNKGEIHTGPLTSKVRWDTAECTTCGRRFSLGKYVRRLIKAKQARRGCPSCGCPSHRDLTPGLRGKTFRRLTKAGLRARFKLTERGLERILSAELVPHVEESVSSRATRSKTSNLEPNL